MSFSTTHGVALDGALGHLIDVQTDVSSGTPGMVVVGRADAAIREGLDRVRMAVTNSEYQWPSSRRTTFLLSPADLPKSGPHFDLSMAVGVLLATGQLKKVDRAMLERSAFIGELTLAGGLRPAPGVLPMALAAVQRGIRRIFVPEPQCEEAQLVPDLEVIGVRSLAQVAAVISGADELPLAPPVAELSGAQLVQWRGADRLDEVDLSDLAGMADEKYAVEVAAAGGHAILLTGPKGCGKTSLAERVPTLLPDLALEEALELTALQSLAGAVAPGAGLARRPPFAAPHHDASKASVIGGGTGRVRPGELSLAHCGVLFLDEFPLFRADLIEALRQPLESSEITIARREESVTLPARALVVLASNPCPCGNWTAHAGTNRCRCLDRVRRVYEARMSGPIVDRIDIVRHVRAMSPADVDPFAPAESSAVVRERVAAARARQAARFEGCGWRLNAHVPGPRLKDDWPLEPGAARLIDAAAGAGRLSARGVVRVQRLAWTIADLQAVDAGRTVAVDRPPGVGAVEIALRLRSGTPLDSATVRRRAAAEEAS